MSQIVILGAGLAGISASYHIKHSNCTIFEAKNYYGGHVYSYNRDGFTWDEGPHVSFTKSEYVRELFSKNVKNQLFDYEVQTINYFNGQWIPHPAQSNLWALDQELKKSILDDFNKSRGKYYKNLNPVDYQDWLHRAFGSKFSRTFSEVYTKKYWTLPAKDLTVDWVGNRVFYPKTDEVNSGSVKPLEKQTHYISHVRYPKNGGFFDFVNKLYEGAKIELNHLVENISFVNRVVTFSNGNKVKYDTLVNTIPLPELIKISDAPTEIKMEAEKLSCSSVLLVNVTADHPTRRQENWIYVYNDNFLSTRLYCTELMSPNNAPEGKTGIQVEVYFSKYRPKVLTDDEISQIVVEELIEMRLIDSKDSVIDYHTKWVEWANVIFDHDRKSALNKIYRWLESVGLTREFDELDAMTSWDKKIESNQKLGKVILAGRYAQWKYYWSDDCILRGKYIAENINCGL